MRVAVTFFLSSPYSSPFSGDFFFNSFAQETKFYMYVFNAKLNMAEVEEREISQVGAKN